MKFLKQLFCKHKNYLIKDMEFVDGGMRKHEKRYCFDCDKTFWKFV